MGFQLAPTATADGFRLEAHDAVGSTNALALERAMAGELRLVLGLSGAFVLFYVLIGGPIGRIGEAAASAFF
jgi:hypothetical protein